MTNHYDSIEKPQRCNSMVSKRMGCCRAVIILASICVSSIVSHVDANEYCGAHIIDKDELTTISKIVHSCESDVKNKRRTTGFGEYLCLGERIHTKTADRYLKRVRDAKYIFISGNYGGVSVSGAEIGGDIFDHKRTVIIDGFCLSACANYILPAAERIIFVGPSSKSFPGWHGSSAFDGSIMPNVSAEKHQMAFKAHQDFLERFTPTRRDQLSRLMSNSRDGLSNFEERKLRKLWTYSDDELCQKFGFDNISRLSYKEVGVEK